jgi:indolepyruvate ferredoxin oxidoreductase beta subunit
MTKPFTILIAAMGGEGGGVLADWLVDAATSLDFPVQSTSVPGVAQRTGATTYYVEIYPERASTLGGQHPVLCLTPSPGNVDIVAASELVEAGRVLQSGLVNPNKTVLISSTHREYAVSEKAAMGDGRYDAHRVVEAARKLAQHTILFDMRALAQKNGTVINTVIFGAMVGSGVLPLPREACEDAIRRSGKSVENSIKGFSAGFSRSIAINEEPTADRPRTEAFEPNMHARVKALPPSTHGVVSHGVALTSDYQGAEYAKLYLRRVEETYAQELESGAQDFAVTKEAARYLALWMSYEDVIRVADLKTRKDRLVRVRKEVGARDGEPVRLTEYLKPGLDEICSVLPPVSARWLRNKLAAKARSLNVGLHMRTDTVIGFAMLCVLRSLRPFRPRTSRYVIEQQAIDQWLSAVRSSLARDGALALELAQCGNLVKGYGETNERGRRNLNAILEDVARTPSEHAALTERVRKARVAALSDPEGRELYSLLGLQRPEPKLQPIKFVRRARST